MICKGTSICLLAVLVSVLPTPSLAGQKKSFVEGDSLEFELPDVNGRIVKSSGPELNGKVVLVDLWATYCPPCLTEIPTFVDLQSRLGERGLVIVGIAFEGEEDAETRQARLRDFAEEQGINYLILDGGRWSGLGDVLPGVKNVRGMPFEIVVDRDGRVVDARHGYGYKKKWARKLEEELRALTEP